MFCTSCHRLMTPDRFGYFCSGCHVFEFREQARPNEFPPAVTSCAMACLALSSCYPAWPSNHPELSFAKNARRVFFLLSSNFPRHLWRASLDSRAKYAKVVFNAARASEHADSRTVSGKAFEKAEHFALVHLKRLVYGLETAKLAFNPRVDGAKRREFLVAARKIRDYLETFIEQQETPETCEVCGMVGRSSVLQASRREGCSDCLGTELPFVLDERRLMAENLSIEDHIASLGRAPRPRP